MGGPGGNVRTEENEGSTWNTGQKLRMFHVEQLRLPGVERSTWNIFLYQESGCPILDAPVRQGWESNKSRRYSARLRVFHVEHVRGRSPRPRARLIPASGAAQAERTAAAEWSTGNILARGSGHPILDAKRQGWGEHGFRSSVFHVERQARLRGRHGLPGDHFHTLSPRLFHVEHREMARHGRTVSRSPTLAAKARLGWGTRCCSSPAFHVEHSN
jgi:hypothetical protein